MKEIILLKSGEIVLKGLNRRTFEDMLLRNARYSLRSVGKFCFTKAQSTIYAQPEEECDIDLAVERLSKVFGFAGICRAGVSEKNFETIAQDSILYFRDVLNQAKTFKVTAKRADKSFPLNSPAICRELGGVLLDAYPHLKVDVNHPEVVVTIEIRDTAAYLHTQQQSAACGIPVGSGGKGALLISGGIDSPVAGWMMAKRGMELIGIHFESPPYTSQRALLKVQTLCEKMSFWTTRIRLFVVPFTKIQVEIKNNCPEELFTLIMRRYMMRIAEQIAQEQECSCLITGESLGQVASQTISAISCTEKAVQTMPVLRPVIGMDKEEIVAIARRIDTFETSILPYEDCCTVFTPKHPKTRPNLPEIINAEQKLEKMEELLAEALQNTTITRIDSR